MEATQQARVRYPAPAFSAQSYWDKNFKEISLEQFKGKYVVLFWYPLDFTFVCPTEIIEFSDKAKMFSDIDCQVIGASCDSHFVHKEWTLKPRNKGGIGEMNIPLLADKSQSISRSYGALITEGPDAGVPMRATYIIDGSGVLRHMQINDLPVGRSVDEIFRLVTAFQYTDKYGEVCPMGWKKGDATMVPDADAAKTKEYFENANK